MFNTQRLIIEHFVEELRKTYQQNYGATDPPYGEITAWVGRLALENIANSDMLYHNVEHTIMVTLVGQAILQGKHLLEGGVTPRDWFHFIAALLCHDIGYVRGICRDDRDGRFATGVEGKTIAIPPGATDASLTPYHLDRGTTFVRERFGKRLLRDIDAELIVSFIEMTRFPPQSDEADQNPSGYPGLARAADFIGQLGDPNYLKKIPALFYEFEEIGANEKLGYESPGDMRSNYARFYWNVISPYIQDALRYLRVTQEGKQWIANLHSHVFAVEHGEI
ncbi:MAG: metal-dependent phosphohydrolase [Chloroflexi bacterium]|nr:MAG: metal-dependent phosphohydrolase [Chloroflexota bacterium]